MWKLIVSRASAVHESGQSLVDLALTRSIPDSLLIVGERRVQLDSSLVRQNRLEGVVHISVSLAWTRVHLFGDQVPWRLHSLVP